MCTLGVVDNCLWLWDSRLLSGVWFNPHSYTFFCLSCLIPVCADLSSSEQIHSDSEQF